MSDEQKPLTIDLRLGIAVCEIAERACISEGERLAVESLSSQLKQEQQRIAIEQWRRQQGQETKVADDSSESKKE